MIFVNLSINQLMEAIQNLSETEKQQIRSVLDNQEIQLTEDLKNEILRRESEYKLGQMKTYTLDEVKASFNFKA